MSEQVPERPSVLEHVWKTRKRTFYRTAFQPGYFIFNAVLN